MDREKTRRLKKFVNAISKNFSPCEIILFGSRADNSDWKRSDFDIIIVSDKFKGMQWLKRISNTVKHWELDEMLDILPYTREEFEHKKKNFSFIREVLEKSTVLNKTKT